MVSFTDSAVNSSPLWNLTPRRSVHRSVVGDTCSHFVTSDGIGSVRSFRQTNPSNMCWNMAHPGTPASTRGSRCPGSLELATISSAACALPFDIRPPNAPVAAPVPTASCNSFRRVMFMLAFLSSPARSLRTNRRAVHFLAARLELVQIGEAARAGAGLDLLDLPPQELVQPHRDPAPPALRDDPPDHVVDLGRALADGHVAPRPRSHLHQRALVRGEAVEHRVRLRHLGRVGRRELER